ncbi:MAG: efflux RND transporter permease subunit [Gammaproteobacteria bacterium]|nr:efflux RND transporter permease subunit [Gammaproteobacteria bacterium]
MPTTESGATKLRWKGPFDYMVHNHVAVTGIMLLLLGVGIFAFSSAVFERYPLIDLRTIAINVPYDGATPREVEEDIVRRIEERLVSLDGVERITSNAWRGRGEILVELEQWTDVSQKLEFVRTAVQSIEDFPPAGADEPEIVLKEILRNVLSLAVTSATRSEVELRAYADYVREQLLLLPSVRVADLVGAREREIQIEVDERQLIQHQLTIHDVAVAIRQSSANVSGGELATQSGSVVISALDKRNRGEEFKDIVVLHRPDGTIVRLSDVATVRDGFVEDPIINTINGVPAVFIDVAAPPGIDPVTVMDEVDEFLDAHAPPPGMNVEHWLDRVFSVERQLTTIGNGALIGAVLVFLVLILVFDLRIGFWITVGIPTAVIGSFIALHALSVTLNVMVVLGVAVVIGIVVDDAVIVGESIARHRRNGLSRLEASIVGAREVMVPVVVGVVTTMIAFAALLPLDGNIGQLISTLALVVIVVLFFSLFDAFFLLPAHLSSSWPRSRWPLTAVQVRTSGLFESLINDWLTPLIAACTRRPIAAITACSLVIGVAVALFMTNIVKFDAVGDNLDERQLQVDLTMAIGSTFDDTVRATEQIVWTAYEANETTGGTAVNAINVIAGMHRPVETLLGLAEPEPAQNRATVQLRLNIPPDRDVSVAELKQTWINHMEAIEGLDRLAFRTSTQATAAAVAYVLLHPDEEDVVEAAEKLKAQLVSLPAVYAVEDTLEYDKINFEVDVTNAGRASGLSEADVARQLRNRYFGAKVDRIVRNSDNIDVMVRYPVERRSSHADLENELIALPNGSVAAFSRVAETVQHQDLAQRQRVDGWPAVTFTVYYNNAISSSEELEDLMKSELLSELALEYPRLNYLPTGSSRDTVKTLSGLAVTFPIALTLIFAIVSIQLRSLLQPLYVLVGIPLALAGAIYLHWALGYPVKLTSLYGLVAVSGVVVNDALVLLHAFNKIRRENPASSVAEAVSAAAQLRARAIFITTATTIIGLLPIVYSKSESIMTILPLFVSLIGGMAFASLGPLFLVPAIMTLVDRIANVGRRRTPALAT